MSKKSKFIIIIVLVIAVLFLLFFRTMGQKYNKSYALWQSRNIQNYAYTVNLTGEIDESRRVDVDIARVVVYDRQNDENLLNNGEIAYIKNKDISSMENIFKRIEKLVFDKEDEYLMGMCIDYDSQYGYPKTFTIGYKSNVFRRTYNIKDFKILSAEKLKERKSVCATYTAISRGTYKSYSFKIEDRNYRNRYAMEMAGAVYKYDGRCKLSQK